MSKSIIIGILVGVMILDFIGSYGIYDENLSLKDQNAKLEKELNDKKAELKKFDGIVPSTCLRRIPALEVLDAA